MEKNFFWLSSNKFFYIDKWILEKLKSKKIALAVLVILFAHTRNTKNKMVLVNQIRKFKLGSFESSFEISKSSFYQGLNDLKKANLIDHKNGLVFLKCKLFSKKLEFIKFHKKEIIENIGKLSASSFLALYLANFLMNTKKVQKHKQIHHNDYYCMRYRESNINHELCLDVKIKKVSMASFTFKFFERWNLTKYQIQRIFKNPKILEIFKKVFGIDFFWKQIYSKTDRKFKTFHFATKTTYKFL